MIFFLILLILIVLYKSKINLKNFNTNYMSIDQTRCINAIFVILVFLSHVKTYVILDDVWYNSYFLKINIYLSQLIVTTFLFFSGFGIMESIKNKKELYINSIPKKRFLNTLINFDFAILLFLICNLLIGENYNLKTIILSFTGWSAIGNSNWYIFDILVLYIITFISFKLFNKDNLKGIVSTLLLSLLFICFLRKAKYRYWYDTILCFPAGMLYSYYRTKIENLICKNNKTYFISLFSCIICFILLHKISKFTHFIVYELASILFVIVILLICMKFSFRNKILDYFGNNVFWIYILQRIPMIILTYFNIQNYNSYLFIILSFVFTLLLTEIVKWIFRLFNNIVTITKNKFIHNKSEL